MSIRIHQLSKKIGVENKELVALLQERGFNVTSASSTIDNISAGALEEEYAAKAKAEKQDAVDGVAKETVKETPTVKTADREGEPVKPAGPRLPPGVFVKSAQQVVAEREAALEASRPKPVQPSTPRPANLFQSPPPPPPSPEQSPDGFSGWFTRSPAASSRPGGAAAVRSVCTLGPAICRCAAPEPGCRFGAGS